MKLLEKPQTVLTHEGVYLSLKLSKNDVQGVQSLIDGLGEIDPTKDYDITIKKHYEKRSLDANRYAWKLIGKLAIKQEMSKDEVYQHFVRQYGVYDPVAVQNKAFDRLTRIWGSKGLGWLWDDLGPCRNTPDARSVMLYYGSSAYNTKEMARLIDGIIYDCKGQGIETLPPDEIERLKEMWK